MCPLHLAILIVAGLLGGLSSGMLGVAGAVIMVPVQFWVFQSMGVDPTIAIRMSFGTSLLVILPTVLGSAIAHHRKRIVLWKAAAILGLTGANAAFFGAYFASKFSDRFLSSAFGCILILLAIGMLTSEMPLSGKTHVNHVSRFIFWGSLFGFVSGMVGVGGGGLMIPVMINFLGFSVHEAVATSSALMIFTALGGSVSYLVNGLGVHGLPRTRPATSTGSTSPC